MLRQGEAAAISAVENTQVGDKVYAKSRPFFYDRQLDLGECTKLAGMVNDERLLGIGYLAPLRDTKTAKCPTCKAEFVEAYVKAHVGRTHGVKPAPAIRE